MPSANDASKVTSQQKGGQCQRVSNRHVRAGHTHTHTHTHTHAHAHTHAHTQTHTHTHTQAP